MTRGRPIGDAVAPADPERVHQHAGHDEPRSDIRSGGIVSTPTRIARYVEPHTT